MSPRTTRIALACVLGATLCNEIYIQLIVRGADLPRTGGFFWLLRNPFNYSYTMFVAGWVAAAHFPQLQRTLEAHRRLLGALCLLGIGIWTASHIWSGLLISGGFLRFVYTLSVILGLILLTRNVREVRWIRFLSDSTLALYLYHHIFQIMAAPYVTAWHPLARIFTLVFVGLLGASALCLVGRWLFGPRARTLLGA